MATKKDNIITGAVGIIALLIVGYVGYKLVFGKKVQAATNAGVLGPNLGGYGGTATYPYSSTPSSSSGSLLSSLLRSLGGQGSKSGTGSGSSTGNGGSIPLIKSQTQQQLQQEMQQIASYSSTANNMPNYSDLGGYSLSNLPSGYDQSGVDLSGFSIPQQQTQNFDFGSWGVSPTMPDLGGYQSYGGDINSMDTGDYTDLGYIDG